MLNVCLLTLTWMADPSAVNFDASNVVVPMSTCARPAVRVAEAQSSCAMPLSLLSGVPLLRRTPAGASSGNKPRS